MPEWISYTLKSSPLMEFPGRTGKEKGQIEMKKLLLEYNKKPVPSGLASDGYYRYTIVYIA
jgi:hypothetical protein